MQLSKFHLSLLAMSLAAGLSGCGGDTGHTGRDPFVQDFNAEPAGTYSGQVMDGYLRQVTVWIDVNNNRLLDTDEPFTESGALGRFTFTKEQLASLPRPHAYPMGAKVLAGTSLDEDTGALVDRSYILWAPAVPQFTYRLISPFTTLVKAERDLASYRANIPVYSPYTPPAESVLISQLNDDLNSVRTKLGVSENLMLDYLVADNPRLHIYARALVRAMQDYVETSGGLDALVNTETFPVATVQALLDSLIVANKTTQLKRIAEITGVPEARVLEEYDAAAKDGDGKLLAPEALAQTIADLVVVSQIKIDALGRALVNQGQWVISSVDAAAGENPTLDAYRALDLSSVESVDLRVLEDDPLKVYRKKIYTNSAAYVSPTLASLGDTLGALKGESPFATADQLTQVQYYEYDQFNRLQTIKIAGSLQEWRWDLLFSYPIHLKALFPPNWSFTLLDDSENQQFSTVISLAYESSASDTRQATQTTISIQNSDSSEPQVGTRVVSMPEPEPSTAVFSPEELWFKTLALPAVEDVELTETFPGTATLSASTADAIATRVSTAVTGDHVSSRTIRTQADGSFLKTHAYNIDGGKILRDVQLVDDAVPANRAGVVRYLYAGATKSSAQVSFVDTSLGDYCVNYTYDAADQLRYAVIQLSDGRTCSTSQTVMTIQYDYKRLSELLVR